ncbi:MAG TPA: lipase family protein [Polyangia bacterium]
MNHIRLGFFSLLVLGCGNNSHDTTMDMATATLGPAPPLAIACADASADVYSLPAGLPTMDPSHRGDVFHCAVAESLTADKVSANSAAYGSTTANAVSGFWSYRVAYRTLRNTPDAGGTPVEGDSAAILLVPEKPVANGPLVVWAHGSVGIAPGCAPSLTDLTAPGPGLDFPASLYKLAGYGYTVIAPDYAGFSYGQPPGYFNAEDEAHSLLDATRAAAQLLPSMPANVVIVGHSQGGHAALAAQSYAHSYGLAGTLAGVAVLAPFWTSMSIWAAGDTDATGLMTASDSSAIFYTMQYAYSSGLLHGDAGDGLAVFQSAKQSAVKDALVGGACYDTAKLTALGARPSDFFDADYVSNVGFNCAANPLGSDCTQAPSTPAGDAPLWSSRWQEDRPALDPMGAPLLVWYGGMDTYIKPGWAECAREKFAGDLSAPGATTTIRYCFDPAADHGSILNGSDPDYINAWIAAQAGAGADPGSCMPFPTGMTCLTPPSDI